MSKEIRNVESYWERKSNAERKRPHEIRYWRDRFGRWQYEIVAGNYVVIADSKKVGKIGGYATKRWALRKAKQSLPRGVDYRLRRLND